MGAKAGPPRGGRHSPQGRMHWWRMSNFSRKGIGEKLFKFLYFKEWCDRGLNMGLRGTSPRIDSNLPSGLLLCGRAMGGGLKKKFNPYAPVGCTKAEKQGKGKAGPRGSVPFLLRGA